MYRGLMSEKSAKHDQYYKMKKPDRLSALMSRFELQISPCALAEANFLILGEESSDRPAVIRLEREGGFAGRSPARQVLLSAQVLWGASENPLFAALPGSVQHPLDDPEMQALATLILAEQNAPRCGSASVLNRLCEVLFVRLMRAEIENGSVQTGILGGLADPRLSRAIVAIHDQPGRAWRVDTLAAEAGLSVSRFSELFRNSVGQTPLSYLRRWRLTLARQDIERGERIQRVAGRYGYGSGEALSRAVSLTYGTSPIQIRKAAATADHRTPQ